MIAPVGAIEILVPGRVCLLGEHSDWAGPLDGARAPGRCIAACTAEGIHASVWLEAHRGEANTINSDGVGSGSDESRCGALHFHASNGQSFSSPLCPAALLRTATTPGHYFAYVAGTAAVVLDTLGQAPAGASIVIYNDRTTVPQRKGFSSSAAVCVLVVRAMAAVMRGGEALPVATVMDLACRGEWAALSMCGRMDQCVAFGAGKCVEMVFDRDGVRHAPLGPATSPSPHRINFVVADLQAGKDTQRILSDLHEAFRQSAHEAVPVPSPLSGAGDVWDGPDGDALTPHTSSEGMALKAAALHGAGDSVCEFLGTENAFFVALARRALQAGDASALGRVFSAYQRRFDACLGPHCPELAAPRLRSVLADPTARALSWGGKGLGSQGDGAAQFVCRDETSQQRLMGHLEQQCGCTCFAFSL